MGPFPRAIGGYEYLYIAIDKFTKCPEAIPVVKVTKNTAIQFIRGTKDDAFKVRRVLDLDACGRGFGPRRN